MYLAKMYVNFQLQLYFRFCVYNEFKVLKHGKVNNNNTIQFKLLYTCSTQ